ncbi:hypothetical protein CIHG_10446 [Coccidioides immitis H538.4]|uniref:Uncharacterized protein n=1 Tax=Coccidioides immitis H538.4 TaxID=396776 RepID=A0A0J8S652_COCIT|nr:hypothetical protein CIHG_10446 [Coccidioides immitis H538.4]
MNVSDLRVKLYRREPAAADIINKYENGLDDLVELAFVEDTGNDNECTSQYNDIGTLNNSTLRLVDIENIDLEHIHNLTNEMSDIDGDRDNEADGDNRDDRDNKDDGDDRKSSPHVLENTEHKKARK